MRRQRFQIPALAAAAVLACGWGLRTEAGPLAENPFFIAITGEWTAEGEVEDAEGRLIHIVESWKGEPSGENGFTIAGHRVADGERQGFRWIFSYNAALETVEGEYLQDGMDESLRFSVTVTPERLAATADFDGGGGLSVVNSLTEDGMVGTVSVRDAGGSVLLQGELTHQRSEEAGSD